ncbi:MAG: hypothetical protein PHH85_01425 [Candidatus Methanoperedens sp.]|nr:hypothetical protein [Candidatus Methanoperedens sp.]
MRASLNPLIFGEVLRIDNILEKNEKLRAQATGLEKDKKIVMFIMENLLLKLQ